MKNFLYVTSIDASERSHLRKILSKHWTVISYGEPLTGRSFDAVLADPPKYQADEQFFHDSIRSKVPPGVNIVTLAIDRRFHDINSIYRALKTFEQENL